MERSSTTSPKPPIDPKEDRIDMKEDRMEEVNITSHTVQPLQGVVDIFHHFGILDYPTDIVEYLKTGLSTEQAHVCCHPHFADLLSQTIHTHISSSET